MLSIFVKVKISLKWKCFDQKESIPDDDYATRLKKEKTLGARYMFPNVCFICMEYRLQVYKQTCYLFQYSSKVVTETTRAKIKISLTESDDKEILLVTADVNLVAKEFQKLDYYYKNHTRVPSKSNYSTSNASMEDFTPGLNSVIDIIEQGVSLEPCYVSVYYLL